MLQGLVCLFSMSHDQKCACVCFSDRKGQVSSVSFSEIRISGGTEKAVPETFSELSDDSGT